MPLLRAACDGIVGGLRDDGGDVVEGNAHLHGADLDFEGFALEFADDLAGAADGFELDGVSDADAGDDVGTGVFVALVGAGGVGDDGLIELLAEFAAGFGDAAFGLLAELLGGGAILHGGDGLAGVVLEVAHERVELLLQIADLFALLLEALGFKAAALAGYLLLALAQVRGARSRSGGDRSGAGRESRRCPGSGC